MMKIFYCLKCVSKSDVIKNKKLSPGYADLKIFSKKKTALEIKKFFLDKLGKTKFENYYWVIFRITIDCAPKTVKSGLKLYALYHEMYKESEDFDVLNAIGIYTDKGKLLKKLEEMKVIAPFRFFANNFIIREYTVDSFTLE